MCSYLPFEYALLHLKSIRNGHDSRTWCPWINIMLPSGYSWWHEMRSVPGRHKAYGIFCCGKDGDGQGSLVLERKGAREDRWVRERLFAGTEGLSPAPFSLHWTLCPYRWSPWSKACRCWWAGWRVCSIMPSGTLFMLHCKTSLRWPSENHCDRPSRRKRTLSRGQPPTLTPHSPKAMNGAQVQIDEYLLS